jgi:hypothetical protein
MSFSVLIIFPFAPVFLCSDEGEWTLFEVDPAVPGSGGKLRHGQGKFSHHGESYTGQWNHGIIEGTGR